MGKAKAKMDAAPQAESIDAAQAQAALDADKQRRSKEFAEIVQQASERLKCDLVPRVEIVGNQIAASVQIFPR